MAHVATPCQPDSAKDNSIVRLLCCEGKFLVMYVDLGCQKLHLYNSKISSRDYREVRGGIWDYSDSEQDKEDFISLSGMVKINRLPGSWALCKKDELVTNYKWLQQRSGKRLLTDFHFVMMGGCCSQFWFSSWELFTAVWKKGFIGSDEKRKGFSLDCETK